MIALALVSTLILAPSQDPTPAALAAEARALPLPKPSVEDLAAWREHLRPDRAELAFDEIEWLPSMVEGLTRSEAEGKPLLLWLMNGHPLGCT